MTIHELIVLLYEHTGHMDRMITAKLTGKLNLRQIAARERSWAKKVQAGADPLEEYRRLFIDI